MDKFELRKVGLYLGLALVALSTVLASCRHRDEWVSRFRDYGRWEHTKMKAAGTSPAMAKLSAEMHLGVRLMDRFDTTSTLLMVKMAASSEQDRERYASAFWTGLTEGGVHEQIAEIALTRAENLWVDRIHSLIEAGEHVPALNAIKENTNAEDQRQLVISAKLLSVLAITKIKVRSDVLAYMSAIQPTGKVAEFWRELRILISGLSKQS